MNIYLRIICSCGIGASIGWLIAYLFHLASGNKMRLRIDGYYDCCLRKMLGRFREIFDKKYKKEREDRLTKAIKKMWEGVDISAITAGEIDASVIK